MARLVLLLTLAAALCAACAGHQQQSPETGLSLQQALDQLDSLPTPEGVSEQDFAGLKAALADSLRNSGRSRFASGLPTGSSSVVNDLAVAHSGGPQITLSWTYRNQGDYDQNSEANINDLTALGSNLGKRTTSPDWESKAKAADGDNNGEVNISDITPLGANFLGRVDGYIIQASTDPGNEGSWAQVSQVAFADGGFETGNPLWRFSHALAAPSVVTSFRVRAVNGSETGPPSNVVSFDPGELPSIDSVSPTQGVEGLDVQFTAQVSGGNPPFTFAWDFGGGATPDPSSEESPTVMLGAVGTYNASLTVTNLAGSDTFDFTLEVLPASTLQVISVDPLTGEASSAVQFSAVLNGTADIWEWTFGAGALPSTSFEESPTVNLSPTPGVYEMRLQVSDSGSAESDTFIYNFEVTPSTAPPSIDDVQPQSAPEGSTKQFTATLSGTPPDTYLWDFGGGATPNTSSEASPTVTLGAEMTYQASLTVTNANGSDIFPFDLVVGPPVLPPDIWDINEKSGQTGQNITLTLWMDPSRDPATSWYWDFDADGDGFSLAADGVMFSTEESPTIKLNSAGFYDITVTATNDGGSDTFGSGDFPPEFSVTP